jgi:hypothetical protein
MDDSLKKLEAQLEELVPRALSDDGRACCHDLIDQLAEGISKPSSSPIGLSWLSTAAAASVALCVGLGGGWYLGSEDDAPLSARDGKIDQPLVAGFEQLDRETWMSGDAVPDVYVASDGEVREILQEIEVTKEVVRHRDSGVVVTVETTDHHLVDSVKSEF